MAGSQLGTPGGQRRSRRSSDFTPPMSEINVTPFVDVMLVLLIIFMVAAPMLTVSVPVDLPSANGSPTSADPITISVAADGRIFVQNLEVSESRMIEKIDELAKGSLDQRIYIRGDEGVMYGRMVAVLGALTGRGYNKIGIVSVHSRNQ
jgi:biopolymer transport protein TolR